MKNIVKLIIVSMCIIFTACEDEDKLPFETITEEVGTAGGLRTITIISPTIDLNNITGSEFSVEVEEWDDQDGGLLESVDVFVQFQDQTPDNGDSSVSEALIANIPASSFSVSGESGLPRAVISVGAQEAIDLMGLDPSTDIDGGDVFRFRLSLNLTDGSVFSSGNLEGNITGVFFNSPFTYPANVVCDLDSSLFSGLYQMELVSGSGGFGRFAADSNVNISAPSGTQRVVDSFTWLPDIGGFSQTLEFNLICGKIIAPNHNTGLGCGGSIKWETQAISAVFNPADDSSFEIILVDNVDDGG